MWGRANYFVRKLRRPQNQPRQNRHSPRNHPTRPQNPPPIPPPANVPPPTSLSSAIQAPVSIEQLAQAEAARVEEYFSRDRDHFEYERFLSNGLTGVSCKIRLISDSGRPGSQYFVVKRPILRADDRKMKAEVDLLKIFRGSNHFLQLFYVPNGVENPIEAAPGTTIISEWIENGTLMQLILRKGDHQLPNRILIEFFFCPVDEWPSQVVSFCIGMAWPSRGDKGAQPQQERIPENSEERENKEQIAHNDMHCENGGLDTEGDWHTLVPILKLIDFDIAGVVRCAPGANKGVSRNIYAIGMVMRSLIAGDLSQVPEPAAMVTIKVGKDLPDKTFSTNGPDITPDNYINLDEDIANLVQWCLASNWGDRPSIENLYAALQDLKARATPGRYANYVGGEDEYDSQIRKIVQRLILDAN
ncbi:hypothetical protein GGR58DRAFT_511543 [Xylaria digitata]|nr:hypothetical protein GGR58DRAFT_511543 [Xylaria digitata]